jgi:hypothetical protein
MSNLSKEQLYKINGSPYLWRKKAEQMDFIVKTLQPTVEDHMTQLKEIIQNGNDVDIFDLPPNVFEAVLAHMGYSIECLCKGAIIQNNPCFISNGVMARHLKNHNLLELLKLTGLEITRHDIDICNLTLRAIEKYRYPIHKNAEESESGIMISLGKSYNEAYTDLYNKLYPLSSKFGKHDMDQ